MDALPWRDAWHDALYAAGRGFYVTRGGPAEHFTTATHGVTGAALAEALLRLWLREHDGLPAVVVDVGAGRGELATHLLRALDDVSPVEGSLPDTPDPVEWAVSPTDDGWKVPTRPGGDDDEWAVSPTGDGWKVPTRRGGEDGDGWGVPTRPGEDVEWAVSPTDDGWKVPTRLGGEDGDGWGVPTRPGEDIEGAVSPTRVVAVDVVERPAGLDERIGWMRSPGGAALPDELAGLSDALVIAHEWLDVVPCTVAQVDTGGTTRTVLVDPRTGEETLGPEPSDADRHWAAAHWPATTPGDRIEVGLSRDEAWADLVARVDSGLLVAVDYGHTRAERPSGGTLTAYRRGVQGDPVPDGTMDLTAHVAVDSLDADEVGRQRDLLRRLGVRGQTPPHALASSDPLAYLRALERAGAEAELIRPAGFGDFWWAVKRVAGRDVT
ncbi:SAM-dependent methyltransferase [Humibacillus xanthopallidus]|uniref:SAM-dependent methyltransferase n=1 Tax=Humibacillus xanthopallidus TaxID=412689 RepID=UPI00385135F8